MTVTGEEREDQDDIAKPDRNRNPSVPLFVYVRETLRTRILSGSYAVHAKLPSERELTESFGVSRITVRQALTDLQRQGLVFKVNGKGSFVSKPKASLDVSRLRGFGEAMAGKGYESCARVLSVTEEVPIESVAGWLNLQAAEQAIRVKRLRYLNREPVSLEITWFALRLGRAVVSADLETRDILSVLENECGIVLGKARVNIEAQLCEASMSKFLELAEGGPVLHIERTLQDDKDNPVLYENLFYRGDIFRYSLDVER